MSYTALAQLVKMVGEFADTQPSWAPRIEYTTRPDERWNMPLIAHRVYGSFDEFLVVMAAAGADSVELELTERTLILPTPDQLAFLKQRAGFSDDRFARTPDQAKNPVLARGA